VPAELETLVLYLRIFSEMVGVEGTVRAEPLIEPVALELALAAPVPLVAVTTA
jgi:hypothetical protein